MSESIAENKTVLYRVPDDVAKDVKEKHEYIEDTKFGSNDIGTFFFGYFFFVLGAAVVGVVIDSVSKLFNPSYNGFYVTVICIALINIFIAGVLIYEAFKRKIIRNKLSVIRSKLSFELVEWLMRNHRIFVKTAEELDQVSECILQRYNGVQFTASNGNVYRFKSSNGNEEWELELLESKQLKEPATEFFTEDMNQLYTQAQQSLQQLASYTLTPENQHVIERADADLQSLVEWVAVAEMVGDPTPEESLKIRTALQTINNELTAVVNNHRNNLSKNLTQITSYIAERQTHNWLTGEGTK